MQFLANILNIILDTYIFLLLIRFILQKLHANWYNPATKFVVALTDPIVKPTRKIIPGFRGYDFAILLLAIVLEIIQIYLITWIRVGFTPHISGVLLVTLMTIISKSIYIFLFAMIIWAFMSWFTTAGRHPMAEITGVVCLPLVRITRRFMPLVGGVDLSPMIIMLALYFVSYLIVNPLLRLGMGLALG